MYGAGSIGRGFIGALLTKIGYEVVFVDVNDEVIRLINEEKTYPQIIMKEKQEINWITNIRAVDGKDADAVAKEIADADLLATAVGAGILDKISPVIAKGLELRWKKDKESPIDLLICENLMHADRLLRTYIREQLAPEYQEIMDEKLGLVETSIGRMVPPADPSMISENEHPLAVRVEDYDFLPVDSAAFKGEIPSYEKVVPYEPFVYYLERKLYLHNMAHVTVAFLGRYEGLTYIDEAANNIYIEKIVYRCMMESAMMLSEKFHVSITDLSRHIDDLISRFKNPYLKDTIKRVARDPERKLKPDDRLVGAAKSAEAGNNDMIYLSFAIALAIYYLEDREAEEVMKELCQITQNEKLYEHVLYFTKKLEGNTSLKTITEEIEAYKTGMQGEVI